MGNQVEEDIKAWEWHKDGYSYRQIGILMGVSYQRVQQRIARAKHRREHLLNVELGISLGLSTYEVANLRHFFEQTDLWAPVGFAPKIHRKKNHKETHVVYHRQFTQVKCDCGFEMEGSKGVAQRHNNVSHTGHYRVIERFAP